MKFDFDRELTRLDGGTVPARALLGGFGKLEGELVEKIGNALLGAGLSHEAVRRIVDVALNEADEPLTLGVALRTLLLEGVEEQSRTPDGRVVPKQIDPKDKIARGKLAEKIWSGGIVELTDEERSMVKELASRVCGIELAYFIHRELDNPVVGASAVAS
jgi:hypothetical protein